MRSQLLTAPPSPSSTAVLFASWTMTSKARTKLRGYRLSRARYRSTTTTSARLAAGTGCGCSAHSTWWPRTTPSTTLLGSLYVQESTAPNHQTPRQRESIWPTTRSPLTGRAPVRPPSTMTGVVTSPALRSTLTGPESRCSTTPSTSPTPVTPTESGPWARFWTSSGTPSTYQAQVQSSRTTTTAMQAHSSTAPSPSSHRTHGRESG